MSLDGLTEKVKLKLHFVDYDGDITIPDDVVKKHLETAKTLIDSVYDVKNANSPVILYLYEECVTEYAKYLIMISWAANAIDIEKTPGIWSTILDNERKILRSLLMRLIGDEDIVNQLLGEDQVVDQEITIPMVASSFNMLIRTQVK